MNRVIRLTEHELRRLVRESIKEFQDWKAQMLYGGDKDDVENKDAVKKANDLLRNKFGGIGLDDDGRLRRGEIGNTAAVHPYYGVMSSTEYDPDNMENSELLRMTDDDGNEFVDVLEEPGVKTHDVDMYSNGWSGDAGTKYYTDGLADNADSYMDNFKDDASRKFQQNVGDDMRDYYSGNYKNRLKQKAAMLGNANSGQKFTPSALDETVSRVMRRFLR